MNPTHTDVVPTDLYSIGKSISLVSRFDAVANSQFTVVIVKLIHVGKIPSQTVIVRVSNSSRDDKRAGEYFAKFFDSSYYTPDKGEFEGSAKEFMKAQLMNEVKSYERMKTLQGTSVPEFIGHYEYIKEDDERVGLILLEYIKSPRLDTVHGLSTNEVESLRIQCLAVLNQIHACGVVHNDIAPRNMFWNRNENRVIVCDFASAETFDDSLLAEEMDVFLRCKERDNAFVFFAVNGTAQSTVV